MEKDHEGGVLKRRVKPSNLFWRGRRKVKRHPNDIRMWVHR